MFEKYAPVVKVVSLLYYVKQWHLGHTKSLFSFWFDGHN